MKQPSQPPVQCANDDQRGSRYVKNSQLNALLSFSAADFPGHHLILEKICFTLKNQAPFAFPRGKGMAQRRIERKTTFVMASETITAGLKKYAIGSKLRRLRLRKSMGLLELSKHSGLSPALLSKLERDLMHPTLPTLLRIAMVFSVGLEYFFNPEPRPLMEVVRRKDRLRFPESPDVADPAYYFESLDFPIPNRALNSYFAEFEPVSENKRFHEHPGIECVYVFTGKLELRTREETQELSEGDAIYFDSTVPHGYRRLGAKRTTALVVTVGTAE
jgi:transcriptional regulator with XRE-family HTH domain